MRVTPTCLALIRYTKALAVALGYRDLYTRIHSERVVTISEALGSSLGLDERDLSILTISAAFHDIGKIGVPDDVLLKAGDLNQAETVSMQKHSELGANIILATEIDGSTEVARVIRHHHEWFNGQGYPDRIAGESIPLASRIIGIADSYDAMAVTRAYHPAKMHAEIMEIMRQENGLKHDPELMDAFREIIEKSPFKAPA